MSSTSPFFFSGISSSGTRPRKMMSLEDLYKVTNTIDDVTLYCHLTVCDLIVFETTIKDEKWRIAMDEEIASIEKNNT